MDYKFIPYSIPPTGQEEMIQRSHEFLIKMSSRRSVREFSEKKIPEEVLRNCILAAATAPSGANKQPWTFCLVSDPVLKKEIRIKAEEEEFESYNNRMPEQWLEDLEPIGTDWKKPFSLAFANSAMARAPYRSAAISRSASSFPQTWT